MGVTVPVYFYIAGVTVPVSFIIDGVTMPVLFIIDGILLLIASVDVLGGFVNFKSLLYSKFKDYSALGGPYNSNYSERVGKLELCSSLLFLYGFLNTSKILLGFIQSLFLLRRLF